MVLSDLKTTFTSGDAIGAGTTSTSPTAGSLNTAIFHINQGIGSGNANAGSLSLNTGSLTEQMGSLTLHVGSLSDQTGSLSTNVGSLSDQAGSLSLHAGSISTLQDEFFGTMQYVTRIVTDSALYALTGTNYNIGDTTKATYTIPGGTFQSGDTIIIIGDYYVVRKESLILDTEFHVLGKIRVAATSTITSTAKAVLGAYMTTTDSIMTLDYLHGSSRIMYKYVIASPTEASNAITISLLGDYYVNPDGNYSLYMKGIMTILVDRQ